MPPRNSTIDVSKGIGIILVVLGHNWLVLREKGEIFRIIFSFHMPLFFFLSGVFVTQTTQIGQFLRSRAESLLKPYFAVLILFVIAKSMLEPADQGSVAASLGEHFSSLLYGTGTTLARLDLSWVPLWFLPHLFLSATLAFVLLRALRSAHILVSSAVCLALLSAGTLSIDYFWKQGGQMLGFANINQFTGLPWSLDLLPITSAYVLSGCLSGKHVQTMVFSWSRSLLAIAVFFCAHYFFDETMDLNFRIYGHPFVSTIQAASGIYISLSLATLMQRYSGLRSLLAYIGSGSLFVLIFHAYFQGQATARLLKFGGNEYLCGIIGLIAGTLLPLAVWEIAKRQRHLGAMFPSGCRLRTCCLGLAGKLPTR